MATFNEGESNHLPMDIQWHKCHWIPHHQYSGGHYWPMRNVRCQISNREWLTSWFPKSLSSIRKAQIKITMVTQENADEFCSKMKSVEATQPVRQHLWGERFGSRPLSSLRWITFHLPGCTRLQKISRCLMASRPKQIIWLAFHSPPWTSIPCTNSAHWR